MKLLIVIVVVLLIVVIGQTLQICELQDDINTYRRVAKQATRTTLDAVDKVVEARVQLEECRKRGHLRLVKE